MIFARTDFLNVFNLCHPCSDAATECWRSQRRQPRKDRLQKKLLSVDVAWHDEDRPAGIARKPEKTASASAVWRKHQREHDGKKDGWKCSFQLSMTLWPDHLRSGNQERARSFFDSDRAVVLNIWARFWQETSEQSQSGDHLS